MRDETQTQTNNNENAAFVCKGNKTEQKCKQAEHHKSERKSGSLDQTITFLRHVRKTFTSPELLDGWGSAGDQVSRSLAAALMSGAHNLLESSCSPAANTQQTPSLRLSPSDQVTSLQEAHKRIPAFWSLATWPLGGHSACRVVW